MKQRRVEVKSFQRWKKELDKDYQTITWLECTAVPPGNKLVDKLKCKVCTDRLEIGAVSLRITNIKIPDV